MSNLGFCFLFLKEINFLTAEMGFPIIFLKHVVPSLNRTASTTTNNNKTEKNLYYLAAVGPVVAGEEDRLRFAFHSAAPPPKPEGGGAGETVNFTQLQCFFIEILSIHSV